MSKAERRDFKTSCKVAGGIAAESFCKAKVRLVFVGAESDAFINDFTNIDMSKHGFKMKRGIHTILETKESLGVLDEKYSAIEGYEYKLEEEYQKNVYILELLTKEKSLFFTKDAYVKCAMGKKKESIRTFDSFIGIAPKHFSSKYVLDGYINIVIELALNIRINCEMEGASEDYIHQKKKRKSRVVPLEYKTGFYEDDALYAKSIIERSSPIFSHYFNEKDGSIGFKAVNYRLDIYTGDDNHVLKNELFETGIESKRYYHTELIENKVFVMLECKGINYLLNNKEVFKNIAINKIEDLEIYSKGLFYISNIAENQVEDVEYTNIQFIFMHLIFDGKNIKYKDIYIEQINFDEIGEVVI
jgi:hypothetical protein